MNLKKSEHETATLNLDSGRQAYMYVSPEKLRYNGSTCQRKQQANFRI